VGRSEQRALGVAGLHRGFCEWGRKVIEPLRSLERGRETCKLFRVRGQKPGRWIAFVERLSRRMTAELEPDSVWVIDDYGLPQTRNAPVGVARSKTSGKLGKVGKCRCGQPTPCWRTGEHGTGWSLYLPEVARRTVSVVRTEGIPEDSRFQNESGKLRLNRSI